MTAVFFYLITQTEFYATSGLTLISIIIMIAVLIRYVNRTNRDLARFLMAIAHSDFSITFPERGGNDSYHILHRAFNEIILKLRQMGTEREAGYIHLRTVIEHIGIGLIAYQPNGEIEFINRAAKRILDIDNIRNIDELSKSNREIPRLLHSLKPREKYLFNGSIGDELLHLSMAATQLKHGDKITNLVSIQDIGNELAEKEMQAWQQITRVLNHEILNSVTPITSLASAAGEILRTSDRAASEVSIKPSITEKDVSDLTKSLETIEGRCRGLIDFINSYRNLMQIPTPNFQIVPAFKLIDKTIRLVSRNAESKGISLTSTIDPTNIELTADPVLIEQVLINLVTNAMQSLESQTSGRIDIKVFLNRRGRVIIRIADNGPGIAPEFIKSVFVPFFSTKKNGSGIGLSFTRQIMRLHKGEITVKSRPGIQTEFSLLF